MSDTNVCFAMLYYYQDSDWLYLLNHICIYEVVISSASISHPFTISYLAFAPLSTCKTSVTTYPADWLRIECHLSKVSSSMWLRTNHDNN
jgi:hypothetical protein